MKHSNTLICFLFSTFFFSPSVFALEIWDKYKNLKTLSAHFRQVKEMKSLGMNLNSQGTLSFKKPDFFEWKLTSPKSFGFIFDKDSIQILENGKVVRSADAAKMDGKMLNAISHLKAWLTMDEKFIEANYEVKKLSATEYEFIPKGSAKVFKNIKIITDTKAPIKKIDMVELSDDLIHIEFSDTKMTYEK